MGFSTQFPPEYAVPSWVTSLPGIEDVSWGNDAAPSFDFKDSDPDSPSYVRLWVDTEDPELRENPVKDQRFAVTLGYGDADLIWSSEDEAEARRAWTKLANAYQASGNLDRAQLAGILGTTAESKSEQLVARLLGEGS